MRKLHLRSLRCNRHGDHCPNGNNWLPFAAMNYRNGTGDPAPRMTGCLQPTNTNTQNKGEHIGTLLLTTPEAHVLAGVSLFTHFQDFSISAFTREGETLIAFSRIVCFAFSVFAFLYFSRNWASLCFLRCLIFCSVVRG